MTDRIDYQLTHRRTVLRHLAALGTTTLWPYSSRAQSDVPRAEFVDVETLEGWLRGERQGGVCVFRGIRYAEAPLGGARFKPPRPLRQWKGIREALAWGHPALQKAGATFGVNEPAPSEDCLVLNVWSPSVRDGRRRPVMFYNHGGGFMTGSGASVLQDGSNLARENDVVVVQSNHRLGIMGYLSLADVLGESYGASGNAGLLDIIAALEWTKRNIEAFGGDASNVMIWGESGGGAKTSCLYAMPSAASLFHKASIESGPGVRMTEQEQANKTTRWVLERLGLSARSAHRLLEIPAEHLLAVELDPPLSPRAGINGGRRGIGATGLGGFGPVVDGQALPAHPFDPAAPAFSAEKPLIVGSNRDEAVFFNMVFGDMAVFSLDVPQLEKRMAERYGENAGRLLAAYRRSRPYASPSQLAIAIESAAFAGAGSIAIAERKVAQGRAPVFMYIMTDHIRAAVPGTDYEIGAMHAMDIRLKFNNLSAAEVRTPSLSPEERDDHARAGRNMSRMWAAFARTGQPSINDQPAWPCYTLARRSTMMIEARCHVAEDPYAEERQVWSTIA